MSGNLFSQLAEVAQRFADKRCLLLPDGGEVSYSVLYERAGRFAGALQSLGVLPGDRVVVQVDKSPANLALYLGTLQCGAVYVPLNSAYTLEEVAYFLGDAEPRVFVGAQRSADLQARYPDVCFHTLDAAGGGSIAALAGEQAPCADVAERAGRDLAAIVYTSGTTGRSKGAMLSHDNLTSNAASLIDAWGWRPDDVLLHALPIFHVHGLFIAMHCALTQGTPMIFLPKFEVGEVLRWLPRATVLMGVPTFYTRLLAEEGFTAQAAAHMRLFISGSAPLTPQTFDAFEARTGQRILERYGMSETIINSTNPLIGERVAGTVGFPLPGVEMRVTGADGSELARGEIGMLEVRGPNVFSGYWRMPEKTAEEIREDGYFITGDLGTQDTDGRISIVGRGKDLVISGGYNVYPKEVEGVLDGLDGIRESAVIGVPHADFGEAVVAVVVPSGADVTLEALRAVLDARLARFKQPKAVVNLQELPRNTMGKVQKNVLRDTYAALFQG